jgi:hypothetical protein
LSFPFRFVASGKVGLARTRYHRRREPRQESRLRPQFLPNARSRALDHAITLLLTAETGKRSDIVAATDQLERLLRGRRLL